MRFRRRRRTGRGEAAVELTPLIDVVFLLLIFFMVSTTFKGEEESVLAVELPEAEGAPVETVDAAIVVRVDADGAVAVDDVTLADGEVETVAEALRAATGTRVEIAADAAARHDAVVRVLDAAGRAGLTEVRILTERATGEGGDGGS